MNTSLLDEIAAGKQSQFVPITVDQFREMIRTGIISDGAPIELIDGMMVWKDRGHEGGQPMGHDPRHALLIKRLLRILQSWVTSAGCHLQSQLPVTLSDSDEPEPDIAIILGAEEDFKSRHPGPREIAVVIEVADSSLTRDRTTKQRLYATAGIPTYWIVNLQANQVESYSQPDATQHLYAATATCHPGDTVVLDVGGHALSIDVAALLA